MQLIDSHCHLDRLDLSREPEGIEGPLRRAREAGVTGMLCVGIDLESWPAMRALVDERPEIWASVGVHPTSTGGREPTVAELVGLARDPKVVAIGETGLDYYRLEGDPEWQRERFRTHIAASRETGLPLVVHTRAARADTLAVLRGAGAETGVFHCFTEDWEMARQGLDLGFYVSFSGIVTFRNARDIQEVARRVPLERLLIETDSPWLAPAPMRGKPNEPAHVRHVARFLAELRGISVEALAEATSANFFRLFAAAATAPAETASGA